MSSTRELLLKEVRAQYSECQVVDVERAIVLIPPEDGRYGMLALEVPMRSPESSYHDERTLCRETMSQMNGLTRALPDIGRQTLSAINFLQEARGTIWGGAHMETFLRFGIMTEVDERAKPYYSGSHVLKIVPPQYATDVQIILRTRSNDDLTQLVELLQRADSYRLWGWTHSYARVLGCNHVFGTVGISSDLVGIRDQMEGYWQMVNGAWSSGRENRQYINNWLSGVDFR